MIHVRNEKAAAFAAEANLTGRLTVCGGWGPRNAHPTQALYDTPCRGVLVLAIAQIPTEQIGSVVPQVGGGS